MSPLRALGPRWDAVLGAAIIAGLMVVFGLAAGAPAFALLGAVFMAGVALTAAARIIVYDDPPPVSAPLLYGAGWLIFGFVALALYDAYGLAGLAGAIVATVVYAGVGLFAWRKQLAQLTEDE